MSEEISWSQGMMLEVALKEPDDFLKVRETLTRIGVASRKDRKLYQSGEDISENLAPLNQIKVLSFKDKGEWTLESKYNIGKKKVVAEA